MAAPRTLINVPKTAKRGEIVEIRAMISHPMETGHRQLSDGASAPRRIINHFFVTYRGAEIFSADLFPAMSANPYIAFSTVATESGTINFAWRDDNGETYTASAEIVVT